MQLWFLSWKGMFAALAYMTLLLCAENAIVAIKIETRYRDVSDTRQSWFDFYMYNTTE